MRHGLPRGTVTFLFTDVEDSTRLWEEAPTDMADGLRVHDAIVRGTIERHGGYVFGIGGERLLRSVLDCRRRGCGGDRIPGAATR